MTLIPATVRHPEMTLSPDYGMPSGRRQRKTLRQVQLEAEWRRGLPRALAIEAGRYIALGARIVALIAMVLVGFTIDTIGSALTDCADAIERSCYKLTRNAPPPPWKR